MTAEILILSEEKARCYEPQGVEVCISITNPDGPPPRLSRRFRAVLRLSFSDIAAPSPHPWDALFNEEHAREILAFIRTWYDADRIVIHCMAGLSRSPAVAMGSVSCSDAPSNRWSRLTLSGTRGSARSW